MTENVTHTVAKLGLGRQFVLLSHNNMKPTSLLQYKYVKKLKLNITDRRAKTYDLNPINNLLAKATTSSMSEDHQI